MKPINTNKSSFFFYQAVQDFCRKVDDFNMGAYGEMT